MKKFLQVQQRPKMIQKLFIGSRIKQMTQISFFFFGGAGRYYRPVYINTRRYGMSGSDPDARDKEGEGEGALVY